ncbi:MAG: metallophosphoesterase [Dehalococcoidia bacterium]
MKILHFADLHLDRPFKWLGDNRFAARKRRQRLRSTLSKIVKLAQDEQVDALFCGGDLYEHEYVTPDTAEFIRSKFEELASIRVFIAPGNHDWYGPTSLYERTEWSPNVHVFKTATLEPVRVEDRLTLWGAAHCSPANTDGFLRNFRADGDGINIALFHGSEEYWLTRQEQGKKPYASFSREDLLKSNLRHAFLGHFHTPRHEDLFTYPGNPDALDFGETGLRGAVLATILADGRVESEVRQVSSTDVHDVSLDITGCRTQTEVLTKEHDALADLKGFVRLTIRGELGAGVELQIADLQSHQGSIDGLLVHRGTVTYGYDLGAIEKEQTVRGEFTRAVLSSSLSEGEKEKILATGLRALEGRSDLEV